MKYYNCVTEEKVGNPFGIYHFFASFLKKLGSNPHFRVKM